MNVLFVLLGTQQNSGFKWDLDYYGSLNYCMHRNRLLSSSDYCQIKDTEDPYQGQISWTNVFREEVEIIRTQGKYVHFILFGLSGISRQTVLILLYAHNVMKQHTSFSLFSSVQLCNHTFKNTQRNYLYLK